MKKIFVAFLSLVAILLLTSSLGEGFDCDEAKQGLIPCLGYFFGVAGDTPSSECCQGVTDLDTSAPTQNDRRVACECLKEAANAFPGPVREDLAASLPKKCGVNWKFTVSKNIDCNTIP